MVWTKALFESGWLGEPRGKKVLQADKVNSASRMERGRSLKRSMEASLLRESKNIGVMLAIYITLNAGNKFRMF